MGEDSRWGPGLDSDRLTLYQLRRWRRTIAPHLRWWSRVMAAMQRKRWRRVDELHWKSSNVMKALKEMDDALARMEQKREDEEKSPPY